MGKGLERNLLRFRSTSATPQDRAAMSNSDAPCGGISPPHPAKSLMLDELAGSRCVAKYRNPWRAFEGDAQRTVTIQG